MSVNDRDDVPLEYLTFEQFVDVLMTGGWTREAAIDEWDRWEKPLTIYDLMW